MDTSVQVAFIRGQIDDLSRAMLAKGLRNPDAQFHLQAHVAPCVFMQWGIYGEPDYQAEVIRDPDHDQAIADAFTLIEGLPSAEEAKRQQFMTSLAKVIDLGRENGIEVDYLNPLAETMKRLSENAITYQPQPDAVAREDFVETAKAQGQKNPDAWADAVTANRVINDPDFEDFDDGNITP